MHPARARLSAMPIIGNAHSDHKLLEGLHNLIIDSEAPLEDRLWAMNYMFNDVMGVGDPPACEADLYVYMDEL